MTTAIAITALVLALAAFGCVAVPILIVGRRLRRLRKARQG